MTIELAGTGAAQYDRLLVSGAMTAGGSFPFVSIVLTACRVATADGSVVYDGTASIQLTNMTADITATFADAVGNEVRFARLVVNGTVSPTLGGSCFLNAATLRIASGRVESGVGGEGTVAVLFTGTTVAIAEVLFNLDCVPEVYKMTFNGSSSALKNRTRAANGQDGSALVMRRQK